MTMESFFPNEQEEVNIPKKREVKILHGKAACNACGLFKQKGLKNPKLKPYGKFKKKIMVLGEATGSWEDKYGKPFHPKAPAGGMLHKHFKKHGLDLYRDCIVLNACDCRPMKGKSNRTPTKKEIQCCWHRKLEAIKKYKPETILILGDSAREAFYNYDVDRRDFTKMGMEGLRGVNIPDPKANAWVCHSYHPSYISRGKQDMEQVLSQDIARFAKIVGTGRPKFKDFKKEVVVLSKFNQVISTLEYIIAHKPTIVIDYESSSYRYYEKIHDLYNISIRYLDIAYSFPYDKTRDGKPWWSKKQRKKITKLFKQILIDPKIKKVAQNIKHEQQASMYFFGVIPVGWVHDTMIGAHILHEARNTTGLKTQAYMNFGAYDYSPPKSIMEAGPKQKNKFDLLPMKTGAIYCGLDTTYTDYLKMDQVAKLKTQKLSKAYDLFHTGTLAFSEIEQNGIKIDVPLAEKLNKKWGPQMEEIKDKIFSTKEAKRFQKVMMRPLRYGKKLSDTDLRILLFDILKFKPVKRTKTTFSVDEDSLLHYSDRSKIINLELKHRKLNKLKNTYLNQLLTLHVNGFIYPSIHLNIPRSMRSSSSEPNFQNLPKHDLASKIIRKLIISRWPKKGILVEADYGSMEVRIIACVSKDEALIDYLLSGGDPHGDWAEIIYRMKKREMSPKKFNELRQETKNQFIFPLFYGSYWRTIARTMKKPKWIKSNYQWEMHIKRCEEKFWKKFKGVRKWQEGITKIYRKKGFVQDFSWGFRRRGYLVRNKLYNFPIQGPAYHCLQWTINRLWEKNFYNFKSLLCSQIHDALFFDAWKKELPSLMKKVTYIMTEKIREENPWIIIPLEAEWSTGKNWAEMEDWKGAA